MIDKTELHDFLNNGIRIEIITKLLAESIEKTDSFEEEQVKDLASALDKHQRLVQKLN